MRPLTLLNDLCIMIFWEKVFRHLVYVGVSLVAFEREEHFKSAGDLLSIYSLRVRVVADRRHPIL